MSAIQGIFLSLGLGGLIILGQVANVLAQQVQIDYYADEACTLYAGQVDVTWAGRTFDNCFNYNQGLSANIAASFEVGCHCMFYTGVGCVGAAASAAWTGANCVAKSQNYQSFSCAFA